MQIIKSQDQTNQFILDQIGVRTIRSITLVMLLMVIFLIPWGNYVYDGLIVIFAAAAVALSFIVLVVHGTHRKYNMYHLLFTVFICWALISALWSIDSINAMNKSTNIVSQFLLSLVLSLLITSKQKIRAAYQAYVLGTAAGSFIIFYNYINGIESMYWARYSIQNYEPDGVGIMLALAVPMAAYLTTQYKSKLIVLFNIAMLPVLMYAIFLNGTRTASIVAIFGLVYWLFTHRKASIYLKVILAAMLAISLITVVSFAPQRSVDRIFSAKKSASSGTFNGRTIIWRVAIEGAKSRPFLGYGIGSFERGVSTKRLEIDNAHNVFVHVIYELGIVGLFFYLLIVVSLIYYIIKVRNINDKVFLAALLASVLVSQITMTLLFGKDMWLVYTLIALHTSQFSNLEIENN